MRPTYIWVPDLFIGIGAVLFVVGFLVTLGLSLGVVVSVGGSAAVGVGVGMAWRTRLVSF